MSTPSLFGHLASRFAPHPENLATEALLYVLRSPTARAALVRGLGRAGATLPRDLRFSSQVVAEDSSIPDLIGKDEDGQKRLIVEAKFWAGLTENQPGAYIAQLPGELDSVLLFVAPAARFTSLWPELLSRAQGHLAEGDAASLDEHKEFRRVQLDGPRSLVLMSWRLLLSAVRRDLAAARAGGGAGARGGRSGPACGPVRADGHRGVSAVVGGGTRWAAWEARLRVLHDRQ